MSEISVTMTEPNLIRENSRGNLANRHTHSTVIPPTLLPSNDSVLERSTSDTTVLLNTSDTLNNGVVNTVMSASTSSRNYNQWTQERVHKLISLVDENDHLFNARISGSNYSKQNPVTSRWKIIASGMLDIASGFAPTDKACKDKFNELKRVAKDYFVSLTKTGTGSDVKAKPYYYDHIEKLIVEKENVNPTVLIDTSDTTSLHSLADASLQSTVSSTPTSSSTDTVSDFPTKKQKFNSSIDRLIELERERLEVEKRKALAIEQYLTTLANNNK